MILSQNSIQARTAWGWPLTSAGQITRETSDKRGLPLEGSVNCPNHAKENSQDAETGLPPTAYCQVRFFRISRHGHHDNRMILVMNFSSGLS